MQGSGKYSILNQAHARAAAEKAATRERKDASQEVTGQKIERRDRDQTVARAEPAAAKASTLAPDGFRPSRPMTADAWSMLLPNGPAPGESERGYITRRQGFENRVREHRQAAARETAGSAGVAQTDATSSRRKPVIQTALDRRSAEAAARQASEPAEQDKWLGAQIGDD